MSMDITIEDHSEEILEAAEDAWAAGLEAIGLAAEGHAKKLCPVDTGRLRNSITHTSDGEAAYIGTNVEYGRYVETGTIHMSPRPFLAPAAKEHGAEYKAIMKAAMENA